MTRLKFTPSVLAAAASVVGFPGWAAEDMRPQMIVAADVLTVTGQRADYGGPLTSTATKTPAALIDIPQSVSLITRDLIDDQAMRSMADVVRYVPGVTMGQGEGHRDAPTLRGNATTADFYVDGVRDDVQYFRDLYNAERIEILKGPNALIFGRGGGGGVINRVTKSADGESIRELTLQGSSLGSFGSGRAALDLGGAAGEALALRLNAFYESADSYRDYVGLERYGVNPAGAFALTPATTVSLSYEYFHERRDVDRGVPSLNGLPYDGDRSAYFGNPDLSYMTADVHLAALTFEHEFAPNLTLRNKTLLADYDKFYQNVHARTAVDVNGDVGLQAYNSTTERRNIFNQTDLIWQTATGGIVHTVLLGGEVGDQDTDNLRSENNNAAGAVNISNPTTFDPVLFLAPRTNNNAGLFVASAYIQDQIELSEHIQLIGGVRFDHFDLRIFDNQTSMTTSRTDNVVSPRGGVVIKPMKSLSIYGSYAQSFLPQSGDQFGSLSVNDATLEPEKFENLEAGVKWDIAPRLSATAAVYRLDRKNTRALDPVTNLTVLTGAQRSKGVELSLAGSVTERWEIVAGYAWQDVEITRDTTSAPAGRVVPLTPEHSFSVWNKYQATSRLGLAVGVAHVGDQFTSISNAVTLPDYTRVDAAVYYAISEDLEVQLNVDNVFNKLYFPTAHNDNNITPGAPRAATLTLKARF